MLRKLKNRSKVHAKPSDTIKELQDELVKDMDELTPGEYCANKCI
jgi:hypothetical protein